MHYVTRTGRVLEALPIMMQLRADGVVVGRGFDASGAFVLSGTYHPPSHTEPQVRRGAATACARQTNLFNHAIAGVISIQQALH